MLIEKPKLLTAERVQSKEHNEERKDNLQGMVGTNEIAKGVNHPKETNVKARVHGKNVNTIQILKTNFMTILTIRKLEYINFCDCTVDI